MRVRCDPSMRALALAGLIALAPDTERFSDGKPLGDGRLVRARDECLGTTISWLDEPYWVAHYAGARRP